MSELLKAFGTRKQNNPQSLPSGVRDAINVVANKIGNDYLSALKAERICGCRGCKRRPEVIREWINASVPIEGTYTERVNPLRRLA